jgi:hypothetical protein|nr:MAG TPA: hypothetical protein [Caudoviricetes sp.]DAT71956.1 MAG TPA: membrane protein complex protein [Caudoviricetes sp.]
MEQFVDCLVEMPFRTGLFLALMFLPFIFCCIFLGDKDDD